jgi:hypothetical protein
LDVFNFGSEKKEKAASKVGLTSNDILQFVFPSTKNQLKPRRTTSVSNSLTFTNKKNIFSKEMKLTILPKPKHHRNKNK